MPELPLAQRIAASYKRLAASASTLKSASDELTRSVSGIEQSLKQLNLGVSAWEQIQGTDDHGTGEYWSQDVGYAKVSGRWGLALRIRSGNYTDAEPREYEEWLFSESPRSLRIDAIDKIPDLIERLITTAETTAENLTKKTSVAQELAAGLTEAVRDLRTPAKGVLPIVPKPRIADAKEKA